MCIAYIRSRNTRSKISDFSHKPIPRHMTQDQDHDICLKTKTKTLNPNPRPRTRVEFGRRVVSRLRPGLEDYITESNQKDDEVAKVIKNIKGSTDIKKMVVQ